MDFDATFSYFDRQIYKQTDEHLATAYCAMRGKTKCCLKKAVGINKEIPNYCHK